MNLQHTARFAARRRSMTLALGGGAAQAAYDGAIVFVWAASSPDIDAATPLCRP